MRLHTFLLSACIAASTSFAAAQEYLVPCKSEGAQGAYVCSTCPETPFRSGPRRAHNVDFSVSSAGKILTGSVKSNLVTHHDQTTLRRALRSVRFKESETSATVSCRFIPGR